MSKKQITVFQYYVLNWFKQYLETHDEDTFSKVYDTLVFHEEHGEVKVNDGETALQYLIRTTAPELIYKVFFGYQATLKDMPDVPNTEEFLTGLFNMAPKPSLTCIYVHDGQKDESERELCFVTDFLADMAYHASDYDHPADYFDDLNYGGCISGTVAFLIYTSDCEAIYEKNKRDLELYAGACTRYKKIGNRATQVCWNTYERMGSRIAEYLFPDKTINFKRRLNEI